MLPCLGPTLPPTCPPPPAPSPRAGAIPGSGSGVALVAVSVVAGARLLGGADDSVTVWSAASDLAAG